MCGICGFIGVGSLADLNRMNAALTRRGPDEGATWTSPEHGVHLGHRRLSILDLAGGKQPMVTQDGALVIVFNGEIYNFLDLRSELIAKGYHFVTDHSDTEVLLHGYREWGAHLPTKLNGMWAFAIYDRERKTLFASRDRFGKKPFYYSQVGETVVFGSELSSVRLHPLVAGAGINRLALQKYFGYGYIPAPLSILAGVHKLPGGHSLFFDTQTRAVRVEKYWEFVIEPFTTLPRNPEAEWGEEIRRLLDAAVKRRLVADVPVGVFLSGGIDSSAVTALASRHVPAGRLKTFSIGFEEASFDESAYAAQVAKLFSTDHHCEVLSVSRAREQIPAIIAGLDEPMGDSSLLPTYLLSQFTRKHVTVALGGDAGDELFAGYDPFRAIKKAALYAKLVPRPVHEAIRFLAARMPVSHRNMSLDFKLKRTLRGLSFPSNLWLPTWMAPLGIDEIGDLFGGDAPRPEELFSEAIEAWDKCPQTDLVDKTLQFYTKLYLQDDILTKVDRATMMHGLEARAPFLDIDLANFARRIPAAWKYRNGETKYLLKRALEPLLPRDILYRKKKGFGVPIGTWFKDGSLGLLPGGSPSGLNEGFAQAALASHRAGRSDQRAFLWNYSLFQQWSANTHPGPIPQ